MAGGRPTLYKPEYCQMLIDHMATGKSFANFASTIDVCRDTLLEWSNVHEGFSVAKKLAFDKNLAFWENMGMKNMYEDKEGPKFNSTMWIFNMKARHRWSDKPVEEQQVESAPQTVFHIPAKKEIEE